VGYWEYKTVVMTRGLPGRSKEKIDRVLLEKDLADFGAQGYELVQILVDQEMEDEESGHLLVFKRHCLDSASCPV
jgi:hypothetical protein